MDYLTLNEILECALPQDDVEIPEWGGKVRVRAITSAEMTRCERFATDQRTGKTDGMELQARMVEEGCVEPKLAPGQYKVLLTKEPGILNRIATHIMELSGMGDEDAKEDGDQGEA
jgi:hypothetical protein